MKVKPDTNNEGLLNATVLEYLEGQEHRYKQVAHLQATVCFFLPFIHSQWCQTKPRALQSALASFSFPNTHFSLPQSSRPFVNREVLDSLHFVMSSLNLLETVYKGFKDLIEILSFLNSEFLKNIWEY